MILNPHERRLYTDALRPARGYTFDAGLATTYRLDLTTLLTVPLQLTLFAGGQDTEELLADSVGLLEALRRTTERLQVYCNQGEIGIPTGQNALFSLLEPVVVEAAGPGGGFFHPKIWLLRFRSSGGMADRVRLLVLSRNLTQDHSWDLVLRLEGKVGRRRRAVNRPLVRLLEALPRWATGEVGSAGPALSESLAEDAARADWELPEHFETLSFHLLGADRSRWMPEKHGPLLVISPFVTDHSLLDLAETSRRYGTVVSRVEELDRLDPGTLEAFDEVYHLSPVAAQEETEEEREDLLGRLTGLHAKAYFYERGRYTHMVVGSANATAAGLGGANVEFLAELVGRRTKVGRVESMLEESGLMEVLERYLPGESPEPDPEEEGARAALKSARKALMAADLRVHCEEDDGWRLVLSGSRPISLGRIAVARIWPITLREDVGYQTGSEWDPSDRPLNFPCGIASLTSFFAFHVQAKGSDLTLRFVLNLPIEGVPEERYAAILRGVLENRERFVRYLLLLLGRGEDGWLAEGVGGAGEFSRYGSWEDVPLLEELVRALCREPDRLVTVRSIVERLSQDEEARQVMPEGFLDLWEVLRDELQEAVE